MSIPNTCVGVLIVVSLFTCSYTTDTSLSAEYPHIFDDPTFWRHFRSEVESGAWRCDDLPPALLQTTLVNDSALYSDPSAFLRRRTQGLQWAASTKRWQTLVLGACVELASKKPGKYCRELQDVNMLEAFQDYVDHLDYFYKVAGLMATRGVPVRAQSPSGIHDIDKLDPVMLVGYSEKFEDGLNTELWDLCVDHHTRTNPHHQAHCMWHTADCAICRRRGEALAEMVCDKVSRRLQKNLGGVVAPEMWDVDLAFFGGLPEEWLKMAEELMAKMKRWEE